MTLSVIFGRGREADGTGSGSYPVAGSGVDGFCYQRVRLCCVVSVQNEVVAES